MVKESTYIRTENLYKTEKISVSMKIKPTKSINPCKSIVQAIFDIEKLYGVGLWVKRTEGEGPEMIFFLPIED